jgi:arylsulfatase
LRRAGRALSANGGNGVLKVDGNTVATEKMEHTLPIIDVW